MPARRLERELLPILLRKHGISNDKARALVWEISTWLTGAIASGDRVSFRRFGSFMAVERKGKKIKGRRIKFRPYKWLKGAINNQYQP